MKIYEKIKLLRDLIKRKDPHTLKRISRAVYDNTLRTSFKLYSYRKYLVLDKKWDYLIVLDACRYDFFSELNKIPGKLKKIKSAGSDTEEWLVKNFENKKTDIIYLASNPKVIRTKNVKNSFWRLENVWDYGWDNELDTVPPQEVSKAALKLSKTYPNKRMIIHYMQPHAPYIGKTKITFPKKEGEHSRCMSVFEINDKVMFENYDITLIKQAYKDNLKLVLKDVEELVKKLPGKVVITADHGELFGEKNLYFHPRGIYIKELIEVPWFIVDNTKKKNKEQTKTDKILASLKI